MPVSMRCGDASGRWLLPEKRWCGFLAYAALSRHPRGPGDRRSRFAVNTSIVDPRLDGRPVRRIVYSAEQIAERVRELGREITRMYPDGDLLVLGLLKGSFIFLSDLVRSVTRPLQVDFLVAASYGDQMESSGNVKLVYDPETELEGKHILLVEDIVDSGRTLSRLMDLLSVRSPRSLDICALLHKHVDTHLRYPVKMVGFDAPNEFLVGYGLDHAENFRHLPYIASLQ
jgi:hypoxanthine phosphoribosyltransferase